MKTVQVCGDRIDLGRQGESGARVIRFAREQAGTVVLAVRRAGEDAPYLKPVTETGDAVLWEVDAADTAVPGEGACELRYMDGEKVIKSRVWRTRVEAALPGTCGPAPEVGADWVQKTADHAAAARAAAEQAKESAREAGNAGQDGRWERLYAGCAEALTDDGEGIRMTGRVMRTAPGGRSGKRAAVIRRVEGESVIRDEKIVNAGKVTLISTGLNQWNEKWKKGYWNASGVFTRNTSGYIASEDPVPVMAGTAYRFTSPVDLYIAYFDAEMGFISRDARRPSGIFIPPEGCAYIHLSAVAGYGGVYKNDICVNVSGSRDGEYEPYRERRREIDTEALFEDGMKRAGSVRDELTEYERVRRVGTRPYRTGDETDENVLTDGTVTNYPLEEEERTAGGRNGTLIAWREGTLRLESEGAEAGVTVRVCEPDRRETLSPESAEEMLRLMGQAVGKQWTMRWDETEERWRVEEQ